MADSEQRPAGDSVRGFFREFGLAVVLEGLFWLAIISMLAAGFRSWIWIPLFAVALVLMIVRERRRRTGR